LVKLVRSKEEMNGFERGMILVAYETTPDVIIAIKKAAAIVTDFGGLTSHAAIISREFNIPCIVGTQIATQVLKDGNLVEVDANKGTVKILKKNKSR
ncbi:MAG TPA: PEP-utilizing enzyme, partial [Candidatus Nanoarchaeia archaeon]|nr:PEP-utilizing enzyme [Candidatus Nanoarchaeia archaeon]